MYPKIYYEPVSSECNVLGRAGQTALAGSSSSQFLAGRSRDNTELRDSVTLGWRVTDRATKYSRKYVSTAAMGKQGRKRKNSRKKVEGSSSSPVF